MTHHRKKVDEKFPLADALIDDLSDKEVRDIVIVGAGSLLGDVIRLLRETGDFNVFGILDPSLALKGQFVEDVPILGWLGDIPRHVRAAVIINPSSPSGFDRKAVYHLLTTRGIALPIIKAFSSFCAPDVDLHSGTVLLPNSKVKSNARLGDNCLVGVDAIVESFARIPDHSVVMAETRTQRDISADRLSTAPTSLEATLASEREPIKEIIRRINWSSMEIILVVNDKGALIGTITDGDIRRGILAGIDPEQPVSIIMNPRPVTVSLGASSSEMLTIMRQRSIRHLPVVDSQRRPVRLERMESLVDSMTGQGAVVMAGGLGTRLRPLTDKIPKPLISVAGQPILDHILSGLKKSGIEDVVLSVNYLGERIRSHVGDGQKYELNVNYINEKQRGGTAGAISRLRPRPKRPFIVINGDLLTNLNFTKLLQFQKDHDHTFVMCVRRYKMQVPYGVVDVQDGRVVALREKPVHEYFINAGIYVLKPSCIDLIPQDCYFDMTDFLNVLLQRGESVGAFPIIEYWRDIGNIEDLRRADQEHKAVCQSREQEDLSAVMAARMVI
jgi:NDP-sugar pyrophosphorylase family protein